MLRLFFASSNRLVPLAATTSASRGRLPLMQFSSSAVAATAVATTPWTTARFMTSCVSKLTNTSEFHNIAEHFIEEASIFSDALLDKFDVVDDSAMADGVLQIKTTKGTFVVNKQAPLHQLWYSSPISGPHHYDFNTETKRWVSDKDGHDLQEKMERELSVVCGCDVAFDKH